MPTVRVQLSAFSGASDLTLWLYNGGSLLNTGGDALVETGSTGSFTASVAETISTDLVAVVKQAGVAVYDDFLYVGNTDVGLGRDGLATEDNQNTIISAVSGAAVTLVSPVTDTGNLVLFNGRTYGGSAHSAIQFTVAKNYAAATGVELVLFTLGDPTDELQTIAATVASSTSITVSGTVSISGDYTGEVAVLTTGYTLQASWSGAMETIATGKAYVYKQPS